MPVFCFPQQFYVAKSHMFSQNDLVIFTVLLTEFVKSILIFKILDALSIYNITLLLVFKTVLGNAGWLSLHSYRLL